MNDLKVAVRRLSKARGFSAAVVLTLALGIGASTAIFSVANTLLFRPLPVARAEEIVAPIMSTGGGQYFLCSFAELERWRAEVGSFSSLGAAIVQAFVATGDGPPEQLRGARVDADYFATLGIMPLWGQLFGRAQSGEPPAPVAVLGFDLWQRRYGGGDVLGKFVRLDDQSYRIIGVLPRGVDLPFGTQIYLPTDPAVASERLRYTHNHWVVGRLKPGATSGQADAELKTVCARLARDFPAQHQNWTALALPLRNHLFEDNERSLQKKVSFLGGAVALLLLIACANVANLVLARSLAQDREMAIRLSLGAGRAAIVRPMLAENLILTILGAAGGMLLAVWLTPTFFALSPVKALALGNVVEQPRVDWRVLVFATMASAAAALLFSVPAIWRTWRMDPWRAIQHGAGNQRASGAGAWLRELILVAAIAFSLALLAAAGIAGKSYALLQREPLGFDSAHVVFLRLPLRGANYETIEGRLALLDPLLQRVRALPGVQAAGVTSRIPLHIEGWSESFVTEIGPLSNEDRSRLAQNRFIGPGYFEAIGARLVRGRMISADDRATTQRLVVVNQTFANMAWPGEDAIGKRVRRLQRPGEWCVVVGVIADIKEAYIGGLRVTRPAWYLPYAQSTSRTSVHVVARARGEAGGLLKSIENEVHALDAAQPVSEAGRLSEHVKKATAPEVFGPILLGAFSLLGLAIAAVGIAGLTAFFVNARVLEIGIRMALGASGAVIFRMVAKRTAGLLAGGIVLGLLLSIFLTRFLTSILHKVSAVDPWVFGVAIGTLGVVVALATAVPTWRATRVDPSIALRVE